MNSFDTLFWPEERWRQLQGERLAVHLKHVAGTGLYKSANFEEFARELSKNAERVEDTLHRLPLTAKDQLARAGRQAMPAGLKDVAEWVCTSGTLGKPLDVPLTHRDLARLAENERAALTLAGIGAGDLVILVVGMERLFVAGMAYWLGTQEIGATCVRAGSHAGLLGEMLERFSAPGSEKQKKFIVAVPSFLTDAAGAKMDGIVAIGEPVRGDDGELNGLGMKLQARFECPIMSTYATTEICTTFAEGPNCAGGHLNPYFGIVEALDDAGRAVQEGVVGEIVVTPLGVEGMPLVRFRTGDMALLMQEKCRCGRTTPRVGPIVGRRQQLLKMRGTSIYPGTILEAMRAIATVAECVVVAEKQEEALSDKVTVYLELRGGESIGVHMEVERRLREVLRVMPEMRYVGREEIKRMLAGGGSRKMSRFIDRRVGQV